MDYLEQRLGVVFFCFFIQLPKFLLHHINLKSTTTPLYNVFYKYWVNRPPLETWQSGNAADSKSAEPVLSRRTGSNPVVSFLIEPIYIVATLSLKALMNRFKDCLCGLF